MTPRSIMESRNGLCYSIFLGYTVFYYLNKLTPEVSYTYGGAHRHTVNLPQGCDSQQLPHSWVPIYC